MQAVVFHFTQSVKPCQNPHGYAIWTSWRLIKKKKTGSLGPEIDLRGITGLCHSRVSYLDPSMVPATDFTWRRFYISV